MVAEPEAVSGLGEPLFSTATLKGAIGCYEKVL